MSHVLEEVILIADPRILAIPVIENHDPLVDVQEESIIHIGPSPELPNNLDYTKMRKTVYEKLVQVQNLLPKGLQLCLYEGYRSLQLQKTLFENRYAKVKHLHAQWSHEELFTETTKLVSPVVNLDGSKNIPPHATGGAVDVYLLDPQGSPIEMGIHPKDWMDDTEALVSATFSTLISKQAQEHRRILYKLMTSVGFENYPTEYWHWSYGDKYWAYHQKKSHALYNCV